MPTLPSLFLAHGNPMNALAPNAFSQDWQALLAGARPEAILVISAHWCTRGTFITGNRTPPTIHDFGGFPQALFDMQYPCPGNPGLAEGIAQSLPMPVGVSNDWGLDHGAWSLLVHLFPQADIPVLQLSLALDQPAQYHFQLGQALRPWRDRGVLIIGSGNIVHNIRKWILEPESDPAWAIAFDTHIATAIERRDWPSVIDYQNGPDAHDAVPTVEHYLPLLYAAGAASDGDPVRMSSFTPTTLELASMRSVRFG
jgi:4,5-DOPA dioxygenase extradiol